MEVEVVIHDSTACIPVEVTLNASIRHGDRHDGWMDEYPNLLIEPFFTAYQAERVAFANRRRPDRQHRARHGSEFHIVVIVLPGRKRRNAEPFMIAVNRQARACRSGW